MPYIGQGLTEGRRRAYNFVATSNQTTFTATYDVGYVDVYQNGILLTTSDYTATNGTTVVLAVGASSSDEITIIAHQIFSVSDTVSASQGGTFSSAIDVTGNITTTGSLRGPSSFTIDPATHGDNTGTVVIAGDLTVNGTTTTINSTTLTVDDKNLILASGTSNSSTADGSGLTIDLGSDGTATMVYTHATTSIDFNKKIKSSSLNISGTTDLDLINVTRGVGSQMIIENAYSSGIQIRGNWIRFQKPGTQEDMIVAKPDYEVELYYNGSQKLETTNTGVTVTGITTSTGFSGKIHPVNGTTTNYLSLKDSNELNFYNSSDASQTLHINYDGGNVDLAGSAVTVRHSDKFVGIGTTSPAGKLNVVSTAHNNGAIFDSTGTAQLWLRDTDATSNQRNWGFQISGGDFNIIRANDDRASGFVTPIYMQQAPSNSLVINSSGHIGFGHGSPSAPIDVVTNSVVYAAEFTQSNTSNGDGMLIQVGSTASADYALTVRSDAGNTSVLAAKADGNVGIGTFTPSADLHIERGSNGNSGHFKMGHSRQRRGSVGISSSQSRWYKVMNYASGEIFSGVAQLFHQRGGGFNQTGAFRTYNGSIAGYNNGIYGPFSTSGDSGESGVGTIEFGSDEAMYLRVNSSVYAGSIYFTFTGTGNGVSGSWAFNSSSYSTSLP